MGNFQRIGGNESGQLAKVTIRFENNTYEGSSNMVRYPAICKGTWEVFGDKIKFENACFLTADFDWTLILNGEFAMRKTDDTLILKKVMGSITDIYTLKLADGRVYE